MRFVVVAIVALLSAGCYYEVHGTEIWACGTVETDTGPITGCQPTGYFVQ
jgi:hypothetical protein